MVHRLVIPEKGEIYEVTQAKVHEKAAAVTGNQIHAGHLACATSATTEVQQPHNH